MLRERRVILLGLSKQTGCPAQAVLVLGTQQAVHTPGHHPGMTEQPGRASQRTPRVIPAHYCLRLAHLSLSAKKLVTKPGPEQDSVRMRWLQSTGRSSNAPQTPSPSCTPCPCSQGLHARRRIVLTLSVLDDLYTTYRCTRKAVVTLVDNVTAAIICLCAPLGPFQTRGIKSRQARLPSSAFRNAGQQQACCRVCRVHVLGMPAAHHTLRRPQRPVCCPRPVIRMSPPWYCCQCHRCQARCPGTSAPTHRSA